MSIAREPKFLSENLVIFPGEGRGPKYVFIFPRSRAAEVKEIGEKLRENLAIRSASLAEPITIH